MAAMKHNSGSLDQLLLSNSKDILYNFLCHSPANWSMRLLGGYGYPVFRNRYLS